MNRISLIDNAVINRTEWDRWVRNARNRRIYATSLFLDTFAPGWEALVTGDGEAFMPLTRNKKFGISYLFQPIFVQQLGLFYGEGKSGSALPGFLKMASKYYRFADIALNESNTPFLEDYEYTAMTNYILDLGPGYDEIAGGYSTNTTRNINKALRLGTVLQSCYSPEEVIDLFTGHQGRLYPNIRKQNYRRLAIILGRGLKDGFIQIRTACDPDGKTIAAACFLKDFDRMVFYFSANSSSGRDYGAMFLLIDSFIRQYAGTGKKMDFNGSVSTTLAGFYSSFGASPVLYPRLKLNSLWFPARLFKK